MTPETTPTTLRDRPTREELAEIALMAFDPTHPRYRDNIATKAAGTIALRRLAAAIKRETDLDAQVAAIADVWVGGHGMWLTKEWNEFTRMVDALDWFSLTASLGGGT